MNVIRQIFIIIAFFLLGEAASWAVSALFPAIFIPGTILGMLFLLAALMTKLIQLRHVDSVGSFLTSNMAFFFIPAAVSVLEYLDILSASIWKILIVVVLGVFISFFAVAGAVKLTMKLQAAYEKKRGEGDA
ncbi:MAG: CidA/LrgA family protein [Bacillota bacterium]|nr:CidA/LrgA family protein [Bacillota bacterium]OHE40947.1 MAG: hypothetical protein A2Y16_03195 [Tenericutes bacterium GWF2_57_13]